MKTYEKYKKTNQIWLNSIPEQWNIQRIKTLFDLRDERNYSPLSEVNLISLYTDVGVRQHSDIEHTTGNIARNAEGYKIVHQNDIIVNIFNQEDRLFYDLERLWKDGKVIEEIDNL